MQDLEALPCTDIPESYSLVLTATGENRAIGAEGNRHYQGSVTVQDLERLPCTDIPQSYSLVTAATDNEAPIRAEGH